MSLLKSLLDESMYHSVLVEGGAAGHMKHLFEDGKLKFSEIRDIFKKLFTGKLEIDEKLDGQNLTITYKDGKFGVARNKATLREPMDIDKVSAYFEGRGDIKDAFVNSMNDMSKALSSIDEDKLNEIFQNGQNFMSFEIIYPPTKNVVDYGDRCLLALHGIMKYDEKLNPVGKDTEAANELFDLLKKNDALKQDTFEISGPAKLRLKDSKTGEECLAELTKDLSTIADGLGWNSTVADYAKERYVKYIVNRAMEVDFPVNSNSDFVNELADRLSNVSGRRPTKQDLSTFAKREGIDTKSQEYKDFVTELDNTLDDVNSVIIRPLENLIIKAGLMLMKNLVGYVTADPSKSAQILANELESAITDIEGDDNGLTPEKIKRFNKNIEKLNQYQNEVTGVEGIVFNYKGNVYKMTSTFGAVNQILGLMRY